MATTKVRPLQNYDEKPEILKKEIKISGKKKVYQVGNIYECADYRFERTFRGILEHNRNNVAIVRIISTEKSDDYLIDALSSRLAVKYKDMQPIKKRGKKK